MEIQYIREFVSLAKYGNYLAAAEQLFISQSSLSKHIIALERELGCPLFIRTTRNVTLSEYGKLFLPYAHNIVDANSAFHNKVAELRSYAKETIQLGVLPSFLSYGVDQIILAFRQQYPQHSISLTEDTSDMLLHHLKEGSCNLVIARTYEDPIPSDFYAVPIYEDRLSLLVTSGSPMDTGKSTTNWRDLEDAELLSGSLNSKNLVDLIARLNIRLNIISRMSRASSTVNMLQKGVCTAALMNKRIAQFHQQDGPFKIIDIDPPIRSTIFLVCRKEAVRIPAIAHFMDTVRAFTAQQNAPEK